MAAEDKGVVLLFVFFLLIYVSLIVVSTVLVSEHSTLALILGIAGGAGAGYMIAAILGRISEK